MSLLITGGRGALGRDFVAAVPDAFAPSSAELDIRDATAVDAYVRDNAIDTVIHCAARTAVRYCEDNRADTLATNVGGTRNLCEALARHAAEPRIVYISTACVFPGDDPDAVYTEADVPHPKNYYALTKLMAESVISGWLAGSPGRHALVVRTNFAERGPWKHPNAFVDRWGTYLYPDLIAGRVLELMAEGAEGVVHVAGDTRLSMYEFARLSDPNVGQIELSGYVGPPVTVNMCLASNRIAPVHIV